MREWADRAVLSREVMADRVRLQVMAKLAPHKIRIPDGWRPWTAFDRHMAALMEAGGCDVTGDTRRR
jgi:hypothetical protein